MARKKTPGPKGTRGAGEPSKSEKLSALTRSAGSWKGRELTGAEYVDGVRGDLSQRLHRLGLE